MDVLLIVLGAVLAVAGGAINSELTYWREQKLRGERRQMDNLESIARNAGAYYMYVHTRTKPPDGTYDFLNNIDPFDELYVSVMLYFPQLKDELFKLGEIGNWVEDVIRADHASSIESGAPVMSEGSEAEGAALMLRNQVHQFIELARHQVSARIIN